MSEQPLAVGFFDPRQGLHGSARTGATLLYEGSESRALNSGPNIELTDSGWRANLLDTFDLEFEPIADTADLGGIGVTFCAVRGQAAGKSIDCLGTVSETRAAPAWDQLDVVRSISALFDRENAFLALAKRPRGAAGHDAEEVSAWLLTADGPAVVTDPRLSTVYDGEGRQRAASIELWLEGEEHEYALRGSGTVVAGSSLQLEGLRVHAAVFRWMLGGREGTGAYEVWTRDEPAAA